MEKVQWNLLSVGFPISWNQKWGYVCLNIVVLKKHFKRKVPGNVGCNFKREQQMHCVPVEEASWLSWRRYASVHTGREVCVTLLWWAEIWRGFSSCSSKYLSTRTWWTGSPCVLTMGLSSQLGENESGYLVLHWIIGLSHIPCQR